MRISTLFPLALAAMVHAGNERWKWNTYSVAACDSAHANGNLADFKPVGCTPFHASGNAKAVKFASELANFQFFADENCDESKGATDMYPYSGVDHYKCLTNQEAFGRDVPFKAYKVCPF